MYRSRWFVLAQTDGEPYEPVSLPSWSEERVLGSLGVRRIPFEHVDGNAQGYSTSSREIAISPVAALPHKTLFHRGRPHPPGPPTRQHRRHFHSGGRSEGVALLCCEALDLDGAAYARGYLQHWLQKDGSRQRWHNGSSRPHTRYSVPATKGERFGPGLFSFGTNREVIPPRAREVLKGYSSTSSSVLLADGTEKRAVLLLQDRTYLVVEQNLFARRNCAVLVEEVNL